MNTIDPFFFDQIEPINRFRWEAFLESMYLLFMEADKRNINEDAFLAAINPKKISEEYIEEMAYKKLHGEDEEVRELFRKYVGVTPH
jgi:hypothetical protein